MQARVEIKDKGKGTRGYELKDNMLDAFREAVSNGQIRLALEYLAEIIPTYDEILVELQQNAKTKKATTKTSGES